MHRDAAGCTCILVLVYLYVYNAMHRDAAGCTGVQRGSVSVGPARLMILAGEWGREKGEEGEVWKGRGCGMAQQIFLITTRVDSILLIEIFEQMRRFSQRFQSN